ncbi:MAG: sulfite exporter TauE/SafE family protein [archaeon]|jgi:sulfite exporter TauE/SafE/copper chaperone CopZ
MKIQEEQDKGSKKLILKTNNMVCESCEKIIEKSLQNLDGITNVKAEYSKGKTIVQYNPDKIASEKILETIQAAGYQAEEIQEQKAGNKINFSYIVLGGLALLLIIFAYIAVNATLGSMNVSIPQLDAKTSVVLIFFVGLLTGFHCIGMCGAFVLSYTAKARKENPTGLHLSLHSKYALGKILSYTIIGGIFGLIGSLFVFTPQLRAIVAIIAGLFLILFGLKMLNIFPILRKFSLPQGLFDKLKIGPLKSNDSDPLMIGLMNGLFIACGPLQAMYVLAATSGSFLIGGAMLFAFAIGTLIPMMGFGIFASFISHAMQNKIVRVSGVIVLLMGLLMINNGLALTGNAIGINSINNILGAGINTTTPATLNTTQVESPFQVIHMDVTNAGWLPNSFVLKKGVPVKWIINGKELNGCNSGINVPAYNLNFSIKQGEQTIEFTPDKVGVIQWSCWMGMIQGTFVVREDVGVDSTGKVIITAQAQQQATADLATAPKKTGGCGCGGGGAMTCGGN